MWALHQCTVRGVYVGATPVYSEGSVRGRYTSAQGTVGYIYTYIATPPYCISVSM